MRTRSSSGSPARPPRRPSAPSCRRRSDRFWSRACSPLLSSRSGPRSWSPPTTAALATSHSTFEPSSVPRRCASSPPAGFATSRSSPPRHTSWACASERSTRFRSPPGGAPPWSSRAPSRSWSEFPIPSCAHMALRSREARSSTSRRRSSDSSRAATSGRSRYSSAGSSRSAAASSTSTRRPRSVPYASSSSATRSSRCDGSRRSRSAHSERPNGSRSRRPRSSIPATGSSPRSPPPRSATSARTSRRSCRSSGSARSWSCCRKPSR
jgi:hypothetical protein